MIPVLFYSSNNFKLDTEEFAQKNWNQCHLSQDEKILTNILTYTYQNLAYRSFIQTLDQLISLELTLILAATGWRLSSELIMKNLLRKLLVNQMDR